MSFHFATQEGGGGSDIHIIRFRGRHDPTFSPSISMCVQVGEGAQSPCPLLRVTALWPRLGMASGSTTEILYLFM
jgi:hypothetical protein